MTWRETLRIVFGGLLLAGTVAFSLPLTSGHWDPAWLRVAEPGVVDTSAQDAEVGEAPAAFDVVQRTPTGALRWRLRGERVQSAGDLFAHTIAQPRLWVREGSVTATIEAQGGRVHLPEDGSATRLEIEGAVVIEVTQDAPAEGAAQGASATLRTAALTLWVRQGEGADRVRVECPGALTLEATPPGQAPWTARAASLEGRFAPLDLVLRGPVHFSGAPEAVGPVRGVAREVRFAGPAPAPDAKDPIPARIEVAADGVRLDELTLNQQPWSGEAERVTATFLRAEGTEQTARLTTFGASGPGGVRLARREGSGVIRFEWLSWAAEGETGRVELAGLDGTVTGVEGGRRPVPWRLRAEQGSALVRRGLLGASGVSFREALVSAELRGEVDLRRLASGAEIRERRWLRAGRVRYAEGRLFATGRPARLVVGESELDAPSLRYDPDSGELEASDLLYRASFPRGKGEPQRIEVRAAHGQAIVSSDREAWQRHQLARKTLRREGTVRLLLPQPFAALRLRGEGARRLQVSGNYGLDAEGDRFAYDHERGWASLTAESEQPPARLAWGGGGLRARRIEVQRTESGSVGRGSYWVSAGGQVEATGLIPANGEPKKADERATLSSEWVFAELREQAGSEPLALGRFEAGGQGGITLGLEGAEQGGRLEGKALRGSGARRTPDGKGLVDLELDGPWSCQLILPKQGPARLRGGDGLALALDQEALREGRWASTGLPEATLRKVLRELKASGGLELVARELRVRAERVDYDPEQGAYILRGNPAVVSRGGISQKANVHVLRLAEE